MGANQPQPCNKPPKKRLANMSLPPPVVVRIAAPAKINLSLHVTGKRADGYHQLDSLVVFAGVFDRLTLTAADHITLDINGPYAEALESDSAHDNIVVRAAWALAAASGSRHGVHIQLLKTLPVAAGIGGGSADAAATLRGLQRLWNLDLPEAEIMAIAAQLGADVPVCVRGRPSVMGGIGDILSEVPALPPVWLVLVNPAIPLATAPVFNAFKGTAFRPALPLTENLSTVADLIAALARRHNGLTAAAVALVPDIGLAIARLGALPGCCLARMSGSGATTWGLFAHEAEARAAARSLRSEYPGWWIEPAPLLPAEVDPFQLAEAPVLAR